MDIYQKFQIKLPSCKFTAPKLPPGKLLCRKHLIAGSGLNQEDSLYPRIVFIEAQAGQGKTTATLQWLQGNGTKHCWYRIGPEDRDPVNFLAGLRTATAGMNRCHNLSSQLKDGAEGSWENDDTLLGYADQLCRELAEQKEKEKFFIIFDDLHLLGDATCNNNILDHFIKKSPFFCHFVLISRHPLQLKALQPESCQDIIHLNNAHLALNAKEITALLRDTMGIPATMGNILRLYDKTEGWITGALLAAGPAAHYEKFNAQIPDNDLKRFFFKEILGHLSEEQRASLFKLALLDKIEPKLARRITGDYDIANLLDSMVDTNSFIRRDVNGFFSMQKLFRKALRSAAGKTMSAEIMAAILEQAAVHSRENGDMADCFAYFARAGNLHECTVVLQEKGVEILSGEDKLSFVSALTAMAGDAVHAYPWIRLFQVMVGNDEDPESSRQRFYGLMQEFHGCGDKHGELLAAVQIIRNHFIFSALYENVLEILPRMHQLFAVMKGGLSPHCIVDSATWLAICTVLMTGRTREAQRYTDIAIEISHQYHLSRQLPMALMARVYECLCSGQHRQARATAEHVYKYLCNSAFKGTNRYAVGIMLHCARSETGDSSGCQLQNMSPLPVHDHGAFKHSAIYLAIHIETILKAIADDDFKGAL